VCCFVANQGASRPTGTTLCLSKPLFSPEDILGMPLNEEYVSERKQGAVSVWSWTGGTLVGRHVEEVGMEV